MIRIACDVHTHTLFSRHAYSTLEENVRAASAKNLELLGVTDHFSCMLFDQQTLKNFQYFINMSAWPKEWRGIRLLHGCEADIVDGEGMWSKFFLHGNELYAEALLKSSVFS